MTDALDDDQQFSSMRRAARLGPTFLIYFHIVICCLSLIYVAEFYARLRIVLFDVSRFYAAALSLAPLALISVFFASSRFTFGYALSFYFYTMFLGYLWLLQFSRFNYDHGLATLSAFASALAFLLPALTINSPLKQKFVLSTSAVRYLLSAVLLLAAATVAVSALYNFRLVGIGDIYNFRNELDFPGWLRYLLGTTTTALLPFAFACFVARKERWRAALTCLLLLSFYPITLSKAVLFAPGWLLFLAVLSSSLEARTSIVLSLFLPITAGVIMAALVKYDIHFYGLIENYFGAVNFRMIAVPSSALDFYNDFFSRNDLTYFCQISFIKSFSDCPYSDPMSIVMAKAYQLGNFNASLFATEGIASVGPVLAPFAALVCGFVIGLGNRMSSGLPPRFILLSSGILPQVFLNVPFSTTLLSNGAALLILLWYVMPRSMFESSQSNKPQ